MKINTREPDRFDAVELDEPHFDEEATLLSARPVVPLEVVKKRARSNQRWVFSAVVVVALVVGALSAALIYKLSSTTQTPVTQEENLFQVPPALQAGVVASATETTSPALADTPKPENEPAKVTTRPNVSARPQPVNVSRERSPDARTDEEDRITEERENRRAEKRERRRQRRAEREAQRNADARSDDLHRIREIFEGAPRP